jgi:hypothetical protein
VGATNKCGIVELAGKKYTEIAWKQKTTIATTNAIYENYLKYLNCDTVDTTVCYEDSCINDTITLSCSLLATEITGIRETEVNNRVTFTVIFNNSNYTDPAKNTFEWTYDTNVFTLIGTANTDTIVLEAIEGHSLDYLVSPVSVTIKDEFECDSVKQCYYIAGTMECLSGYAGCTNLSQLVVASINLQCIGNSLLIVTKKI